MEQEILEFYAKVAKYQRYINYCVMMGVPIEKIPCGVKAQDMGPFMFVYTDMLLTHGFLRW